MTNTKSIIALVVVCSLVGSVIGGIIVSSMGSSEMIGPMGPSGPRGERGLQGNAGEQGVQGVSRESLGGFTHSTQETFNAGIAVRGLEIIDSSGRFVGNVSSSAPTSVKSDGAASFNSTMSVGGALTGATGDFSGALTSSSTAEIAGAMTVTGESNIDTLIQGGDFTELDRGDETNTDNLIDRQLTAAQVCDSSVIRWDSATGSAALWFPTGASLVADCLTAQGDAKRLRIENASGSAITLTASTGINVMTIVGASATADVLNDATEWAVIDFTVSSTTGGTVEAFITKYLDAD